jgi:FAD/FMN-containing dehydrogenase
MSRKFGLTIDHLVAAEIVVADGSVLRADEHQNADLFWGIKGAGGNFGVVTSFEFIADEVGDVVFAILVADATNAAPLIETWGRLVEEAPRELTSFISLVPEARENPALAYTTLIYAGDDTAAASDAIMPFFEQLGPILQQQAQLVPYSAIIAANDGQHSGQGLDSTRTGLVDHLTPAIAQAMETMLTNRDTPFLQVRAVGGAVNDVPADATAYAHRHQNFSISASTSSNRLPRLNRQWARIEPFVEGIYLSFESGSGPELLEKAFPGNTLVRLRELKAQYDPENVFNQNFSITRAEAIAL